MAAVLPLAALAYACGSGGPGSPPGFDLDFGDQSKTGGFGASGGTSAPGPSFGITPGKGPNGGGDSGTTEEGGTEDARIDTAPPKDTGVAFDTAGFDTAGLDIGM